MFYSDQPCLHKDAKYHAQDTGMHKMCSLFAIVPYNLNNLQYTTIEKITVL